MYCIEKEEKSEQKQPPRSRRAGTAQRGARIFYRARADRIQYFLAALSPRKFRLATEAGSKMPIRRNLFHSDCSKTNAEW